MAESFSHKWGQIVGNFIQDFIRDKLQEVANEHGLYLDYQKKRKARSSKKVSWQDRYGNFHDLDYVLERGGTEETRGLPAAFIETAWRRYTKHSRNKAQELEAALIPLAETYTHLNPFLGVILAGVFTPGSLNQLESKGFKILYLKYDSIINAFRVIGLDASFEESTSEAEFQNKISRWNSLSELEITTIANQLLNLEKLDIDKFINALRQALSRQVELVTVTALHGLAQQSDSIDRAIESIQTYADIQASPAPVLKYEIDIRYNNGDAIHALLQNKAEAIKFLRTFA